MNLYPSFCNNAHSCNNPTCSTPHMESCIYMYKRSFANTVEHNLHLPGILSASWGKNRNVHCSSVWLPEAASSTTPLLCWLRNTSIFLLHILCFFTCHCIKSKAFYKTSWLQHHDTPLQGTQTSLLCQRDCGKQPETVRNIVGSQEGSTAKSWSKTSCIDTLI